jgi:ATP-dependent helicase/nuclease subunit A
MSFTDRQKEAIRAESHLLMEAGAGTGKTTTLVGKIMHTLGAEVLPGERVASPCELDGIVAITFTEAAASDLRAALRRAVREEARRTGDPVWRRRLYALERARIGTIHSFCGALLREWGERVGIDPGFAILDETRAALLRREVAQQVVFDGLGSGDAAVTALVAELGSARVREAIEKTMGEAALAGEALARWCPDGEPATDEIRALVESAGFAWCDHDERGLRYARTLIELAVEARRRLERRLAEDGVLDFDGMIGLAHRLLHGGGDLVRRLRSRIRWLFIDEFQDTDRLQKEIAYRLCGLDAPAAEDAPRLCVVGDPKQSIYRFRRADVSVWNAVADDFAARGLPVIPLDTNFRSRAPLLGFVNATFAALMDGRPAAGGDARHEVHYAPLRAARDLEGDDDLLEVLAVAGADENGKAITAERRRQAEAELVVRRILQMRGERCIYKRDASGEEELCAPQWRDIALLFRSRTALSIYEEALRRHGIPYYVSAGSGFFARREVRDLVLLLGALADPRDDVAWAGVLRAPWVGLADESLLRIRQAMESRPLSHGLGVELPGDDGARLRRAAEWLHELRYLRDRVRPAALVERALERSGYAEHLLLQEGGELALANLRKLVRMADGAGVASLAELVEWMRERAEIAAREPEARLHTAGEDVVVLTTIHAAKGLEWPVVFLCDLERKLMRDDHLRASLFFDNEAGIGLRLKDLDADGEPVAGAWARLAARDRALDLAEEKRIWYVAATRARDRLVLAGCVPEDSATIDPEKGPQRVAQWLLSALGVGTDTVSYEADGPRWSGPVRRQVMVEVLTRPPLIPPTAADLEDAPPLDGAVALGLGALPPIRPRRRHSATELMSLARNPDEHRRTYGLGLPATRFAAAADEFDDPEVSTDSATAAPELDPREIGNIVHGVLEKLRDDSDLLELLEAEIGVEVGEGAAAMLSVEMRARLRTLLEETRAHPALARLYEGGRAEPELSFTWLLDDAGTPVALRGAMDLVGFVDGRPEIVDFKTHSIQPGQEPEVARRYAIQRQAYAAALAELLGQAPTTMRFFFPATRGETATTFDTASMEDARARVRALLDQLASV